MTMHRSLPLLAAVVLSISAGGAVAFLRHLHLAVRAVRHHHAVLSAIAEISELQRYPNRSNSGGIRVDGGGGTLEAIVYDMVAVALEAVSDIGDFDINLSLVEDVVRKDVVFAVGSTGFQLDARDALEEGTTVDQETVTVDKLDALACIVVVKRAMADGHIVAGGGIQGG